MGQRVGRLTDTAGLAVGSDAGIPAAGDRLAVLHAAGSGRAGLSPGGARDRDLATAVCGLSVITLVAVLLAVLIVAKYEALRSDVVRACPSAAALDLSQWAPVCREVGYHQ